jgi:hypothetical protein
MMHDRSDLPLARKQRFDALAPCGRVVAGAETFSLGGPSVRRRVFRACEWVRSKRLWALAHPGNPPLWRCCEYAADNLGRRLLRAVVEAQPGAGFFLCHARPGDFDAGVELLIPHETVAAK